jgi:CrcB protein
MQKVVLLALGGALGTLSRHGLNTYLTERYAAFPVGTLVVNVTGSFLIGLLAALALRHEWRLFLMAGFCGGYTTFSTFSLQSLELAHGKAWLPLAGNVIASNLLCLVAVYAGWLCGRAIQAGR